MLIRFEHHQDAYSSLLKRLEQFLHCPLLLYPLFQRCNLSGSDLNETNLRGANFKDTLLESMQSPLHMSQTIRQQRPAIYLLTCFLPCIMYLQLFFYCYFFKYMLPTNSLRSDHVCIYTQWCALKCYTSTSTTQTGLV